MELGLQTDLPHNSVTKARRNLASLIFCDLQANFQRWLDASYTQVCFRDGEWPVILSDTLWNPLKRCENSADWLYPFCSPLRSVPEMLNSSFPMRAPTCCFRSMPLFFSWRKWEFIIWLPDSTDWGRKFFVCTWGKPSKENAQLCSEVSMGVCLVRAVVLL